MAKTPAKREIGAILRHKRIHEIRRRSKIVKRALPRCFQRRSRFETQIVG